MSNRQYDYISFQLLSPQNHAVETDLISSHRRSAATKYLMSQTSASSSNMENPSLSAVSTEVRNYMRATDLTLLQNADDENFLIKLLLVGISGGKEEDIRDPSLLFDQLHSQGNRQVCQYQFKR